MRSACSHIFSRRLVCCSRNFSSNRFAFRLSWPSRGLSFEWQQATNPASDACAEPGQANYAPLEEPPIMAGDAADNETSAQAKADGTDVTHYKGARAAVARAAAAAAGCTLQRSCASGSALMELRMAAGGICSA